MTGEGDRHNRERMRIWAGRLIFCVNVVMFVTLLILFSWRGAILTSPWDGPALASVALAAATLVLAAVALGVGLLAVWGYTTLREHAAAVAKAAADAASKPAAEAAAKRVVEDWLNAPTQGDGDELATSYGEEQRS